MVNDTTDTVSLAYLFILGWFSTKWKWNNWSSVQWLPL